MIRETVYPTQESRVDVEKFKNLKTITDDDLDKADFYEKKHGEYNTFPLSDCVDDSDRKCYIFELKRLSDAISCSDWDDCEIICATLDSIKSRVEDVRYQEILKDLPAETKQKVKDMIHSGESIEKIMDWLRNRNKEVLTAEDLRSQDIDPNPFSYYRKEAPDGTVYYMHKMIRYTISESKYKSLVNKKAQIYFGEPAEDKKDMVNHPPHYNVNGFEVIDIIKAFTSDLVGIEAVDTANAIKYILRWKHKNGVEDLEKAKWYLNHLIKNIKGDKNK